MKAKIHKCTICEEFFHWGIDSRCYGSILDEEQGTLIKMCSFKCAEDFKSFENSKVPAHVAQAISKMRKTNKCYGFLRFGKDSLVQMNERDFG